MIQPLLCWNYSVWNYWKICDNIWYIFTMSYDVPFQCCLGPTQWVYFQPRSFEKTVHCAGCRTPSSTRMHWKPNNHCFLGIWHHLWATSQLSHVGHVFCKFHLYPFVMYQSRFNPEKYQRPHGKPAQKLPHCSKVIWIWGTVLILPNITWKCSFPL